MDALEYSQSLKRIRQYEDLCRQSLELDSLIKELSEHKCVHAIQLMSSHSPIKVGDWSDELAIMLEQFFRKKKQEVLKGIENC